MIDLGGKLKELRQCSSINVLDLAAEAKLSQEAVRKIEAGERVPSYETLQSLIQALGLKDKEGKKLQRLRVLAHAEREGILDKCISDSKAREVSAKVAKTLLEFLSEFDMELGEKDIRDLESRVLLTLLRAYE